MCRTAVPAFSQYSKLDPQNKDVVLDRPVPRYMYPNGLKIPSSILSSPPNKVPHDADLRYLPSGSRKPFLRDASVLVSSLVLNTVVQLALNTRI